MSVRSSLKISVSVTTEPIGFYTSGNISTAPVVVLGYFLGGWDTPNPPKNKKKFSLPLGAKLLGAKSRVYSIIIFFNFRSVSILDLACGTGLLGEETVKV